MIKVFDGNSWIPKRNNPNAHIDGPYIKTYDGSEFKHHFFKFWDGSSWKLQSISINGLPFLPNDATAMSNIVNDSTALNAMIFDGPLMSLVVQSYTALSAIWANDTARRLMWNSAVARRQLFLYPQQLQAITTTSLPNITDDTANILDSDASAGYLTKLAKNGGVGGGGNNFWFITKSSGDWIIWVKVFDGFSTGQNIYDWYYIAFRTPNKGINGPIQYSVSIDKTNRWRGVCRVQQGGMNLEIKDANNLVSTSSSYAYVWYIQV